MSYFLLTFSTTNQVVAGECALKKNCNIRIIPLPGEISAGCGLCLKVEEQEEIIRREIQRQQLDCELYFVETTMKKTYTKVKL